MHELMGLEPTLPELLERMTSVDLVLVEGFKANLHPKIEVFRPSLAHPPIWPGRSDIVAVASDAPVSAQGRPVLSLNNAGAIAAWAIDYLEMHPGQQSTS